MLLLLLLLHGVGGHAVRRHETLLLLAWHPSHIRQTANRIRRGRVHSLHSPTPLMLLHLHRRALLLRDPLRLHDETKIGCRVRCREAVRGTHGHPLHSHLCLLRDALEWHWTTHTGVQIWHWHPGCAHAVGKLLHTLLLLLLLLRVVLAWHGEVGGAVLGVVVAAHVWGWGRVHVRVSALLLVLAGGVAHLHVWLLVSECYYLRL